MRFIAKIIAVLFLMTGFTFAQCETDTCGLVARGTVTEVQIDRSDKDYVRVNIELAMEFKNESNRPIILFKPNTDSSYFGDRYYLGGRSLYENETGRAIHSEGGWESIMGSPFYKRLAEQLDTKEPSPELTKILQQNEVWAFAEKTQISFSVEKDQYNEGREKSWKEMQSFPSKLWLRVHYELSPWNVEFFKPSLLRKLAKRWKKHGNVLVERKKDGRYNHFGISSELMMLELTR